MKHIAFVGLAVVNLFAQPAAAGISCLFSESVIHTSQDRHCSDNCGGWAERQPNIRIQLSMPQKWADSGAFFREPQATCAGVGCPWAVINSVSSTDSGQIVEVSYRNWGRPIEVNVQADVCILETD